MAYSDDLQNQSKIEMSTKELRVDSNLNSCVSHQVLVKPE